MFKNFQITAGGALKVSGDERSDLCLKGFSMVPGLLEGLDNVNRLVAPFSSTKCVTDERGVNSPLAVTYFAGLNAY